ncbi:MAG: DUF5658 family protein [Phycisphaerales bacterium]
MTLREPVRHPRSYGFYIALGCVDIILTWSLLKAGGAEANAIADWAFSHLGITGGAMLKFATVTIFLLICEHIARHRPRTAAVLARAAVVAALFPVLIGLSVMHEMTELGIAVSIHMW